MRRYTATMSPYTLRSLVVVVIATSSLLQMTSGSPLSVYGYGAAAQPRADYRHNGYYGRAAAADEHAAAPPKYNFAYDVSDAYTGDYKSQTEVRDGNNVKGQYTVVEPDGTRRVVDYTADEENGFNAVVSKEGHPAADAPAYRPVAAAPAYRPAAAAAPSYRPAADAPAYRPAAVPSYRPAYKPAYKPSLSAAYRPAPAAVYQHAADAADEPPAYPEAPLYKSAYKQPPSYYPYRSY
ncbi:larval cuticle protein A3A-like isoform X2 [Acyrthosiphon pisum]|uniref:Uncharacterized protein n=1 Tax=Acyrthosiphon pisum TaxID=7029 RepID=A0A8R2H5W9_ACYPI|nr:larval cuticle protein A3A-like isoform X2 [Acyrthosiphon pisum]|eukprot:XP_016657013.1 PREDICTED: larval cuticle protein A3A-like isoform X2 [Acyrthosiphon pisum]